MYIGLEFVVSVVWASGGRFVGLRIRIPSLSRLWRMVGRYGRLV